MKSKTFLLLVLLSSFGTICSAFEVIVFVGTPAGTPARWTAKKFPVGYSVQKGGAEGVSASAITGEYKKVIALINKQSPLKFKFNGTTATVTQGDLKNAVFFDKNFSAGSFILAFQRLLVLTSKPTEFVEGDLIFNDFNFDWTKGATKVSTNTFNIFTIMLHEMGHGAGLGHTAITDAVMFFSYQKDFKALHIDDKTGIKFIYKPPVSGTLPKPISPINQSVHTFSNVGQAARALTFRWEGSKSATTAPAAATTYSLVFAADSAFTKNVTRFDAKSKESFFIKGAALGKVKKVQNASSTGDVFWRIEEKNGGQTLKSNTFRFRIAS